MKSIMEAIGLIIDMQAIIIQAPYIFISACILMRKHEKHEYVKMYYWLPMFGFIRYQCAENGELYGTKIKYKDLLK